MKLAFINTKPTDKLLENSKDIIFDLLHKELYVRGIKFNGLPNSLNYETLGKNYAVKASDAGLLYVNVPWADNDTWRPIKIGDLLIDNSTLSLQPGTGISLVSEKNGNDNIIKINSIDNHILYNYYSNRQASMNVLFGDGNLRHFYATSTTTTGKPVCGDSHIIHSAWDNNGGFDALLALPVYKDKRINFRSQSLGTWNAWKELAYTSDIPTKLPASDVYAWAKAATKPSYSWDEITSKPTLIPVTELALNTDIAAIKNLGWYKSKTDGDSSTMVNSPYTSSYALLNIPLYDDKGNDLRRARIAINANGGLKVSNDRGTSGTGEVWRTVAFTDNLTWSEIADKPSTFTPSTHTHSYITVGDNVDNSKLIGSYSKGLSANTVYNGGFPEYYGNVITVTGLGDSQIFVTWNSLQTVTNSKVGTHLYVRSRRDNVTRTDTNAWSDWTAILDATNVGKGILTGYTKANAAEDLNAEDSLNTALGKLEYKSDLVYDWMVATTDSTDDGNKTIDRLYEVYKVLEGINGTETIKTLIGKYLPLTGGTLTSASFGTQLSIKRNDASNGAAIKFEGSSKVYGYIGFNNANTDILHWFPDISKVYKVLDEANVESLLLGYTTTGKNYAVLASDGKLFVNVPWSDNDTWRPIKIGDTLLNNTSLSLQPGNGISLISEDKGNENIVKVEVRSDLNVNTVGGLYVHTNRNNEANKIVRTDANGFIQAGWINTISGNMETTAINRVYCSNDLYIRYKTPANFNIDLIKALDEGNSTIKDGTMFITSYASNNGFADSEGVNKPYKRKAIHIWNWINSKTITKALLDSDGNLINTTYVKKTDNLVTKDISITPTKSWKDTGIDSSVLSESGTYIVQMKVDNTNIENENMYYSGVMSWFNDTTNDTDKETDEIELHATGSLYNHRLYLRTSTKTEGNSPISKLTLQLAADADFTNSASISFNFKKIL